MVFCPETIKLAQGWFTERAFTTVIPFIIAAIGEISS
jgi:hypothetical protein